MSGYYLAETNAEAIQQIVGRVNALHDWLKIQKYSIDPEQIASLMGFEDIIKEKEEKS